jgi:hypothetical protein
MRPEYPDLKCDFHASKKGIPINDIAAIVDEVFRGLYTLGHYNSMIDDFEGGDVYDALYDLTEADNYEVLQELFRCLTQIDNYWPQRGEGPFYDEDNSYIRDMVGFEEHSRTWEFLRYHILHEQRFFSTKTFEDLKEIFDGLHLLRDEDNAPVVYEVDPVKVEFKIYRARKFSDVADQARIVESPQTELGAPPENRRRAGRMNASGILTFYGALDIETCVSELRPAVGEAVIVGEFVLRRPILVLDTTRFSGRPKQINVFARTYLKRMRLWKFMANFMDEISRPYLPSDEYLDYVPTQLVSEYLANYHKFKREKGECTIDAIVYRSAQNGSGKNIAIFGDCGLVEGANNSGRYWFRHKNPGLLFVTGSLVSRRISGISHSSDQIETIQTKSTQNKYDDDSPF